MSMFFKARLFLKILKLIQLIGFLAIISKWNCQNFDTLTKIFVKTL